MMLQFLGCLVFKQNVPHERIRAVAGEVFIDDISLTNAIWAGSKEKWTWGYKFEIATNLSSTLNTQHFYNNIRAAVLDDVVYSTLDGIGIIPGIDSFADAAGTLYAGIRKNKSNFIIYSSSFAIPFAGSIYIKAGAHEAKELWGIVAKKADNADGFVLEAKRIDEILPNEFHISSISYGNEKELTEKILLEAKADVSKYVDKKLVNEALDDLAVQSTAFIKKIDALTNLTAAEKSTLKTLLEADADLAKAFAKAPEEMAGAWKLVRSSIAEGTQFAKDPKTLEKLGEMMQTNSSFRQKLGSSWEQELKEILEKNADLRCGTCGNKGISSLPAMDEVLDNLAQISRFSDKPGFSSVLKNLKSNVANRDGVNHMISYIKKNADEFENITEFEFQYAYEFLNKADVLVGNIKYEFKSWTPDLPNPWNSFFGGTGNSYTQFVRYLQNTTDVKNLKYIFNGAKASESQVKSAFKALLTNKKTEVFEANPNLWKQFDRIGGGKIRNLTDFENLLNHSTFDINHPIFNFIKSQ